MGISQIERSFSKLDGMPCWGVSRGFGSFFVLEFGEPRLVVREPMLPMAGASRRVKQLLEGARSTCEVVGISGFTPVSGASEPMERSSVTGRHRDASSAPHES